MAAPDRSRLLDRMASTKGSSSGYAIALFVETCRTREQRCRLSVSAITSAAPRRGARAHLLASLDAQRLRRAIRNLQPSEGQPLDFPTVGCCDGVSHMATAVRNCASSAATQRLAWRSSGNALIAHGARLLDRAHAGIFDSTSSVDRI